MAQDLYVSRQEMIQTYGFSANLVSELGQPDFVKANAHWGYTHYYDLERVERFAEEHATRIQRILALRTQRQASARRRVEQQRRETIEWSKVVQLHLNPILPSTFSAARRYFDPAPLTRERLLLYLRLTCTDYLETLQLAARRLGAGEARCILRERANHLIETMLRAENVNLSDSQAQQKS